MYQKEYLFVMCFLVTLNGVYNKPTYKSGIRQCFKHECPENTYACEKVSEVSKDDRSKLISEIRCLDLEGNSLKNISASERNPFSPETEFKGYSYTGAFHIVRDDDNENTDDNEDSNKESTDYGNGNKDSEVETLTR